ncbi:MAG: pirin family protein [Fimbriimonadaceae bacterium]|nr:pirin family protein [Fimbriimonadaceae bacterium]
MSTRTVAFFVPPTVVDEAPGVTIRRTIGGERMVLLDPILLCDHLYMAPRPEPMGFHRHPHRGIETLTFVFSGTVNHKDSIGNDSTVTAPTAQWMRAGNGIWHEEMLIAGNEPTEALQLWLNLPQTLKRTAPQYQAADQLPQVSYPSGTVTLVSGTFEGVNGPLSSIAVQPFLAIAKFDQDGTLRVPTAANDTAAVSIIRGQINDHEGPGLVVFTDGTELELQGSAGTLAVIIVAPKLNEPVMQYRSFVMNTAEDIAETLAMIHANRFGTGD